MSLIEKARGIIAANHYASIATASKDGQPWNSPVLIAYDQNYNFYWTSWHGTQHSRFIAENPRVFIVVYDSSAPLGSGECVYIQAQAAELTDPREIGLAAALRYERKRQPARDTQEFLGTSLRRMYKAVPEKTWITLDSEVKADITISRTEISLI